MFYKLCRDKKYLSFVYKLINISISDFCIEAYRHGIYDGSSYTCYFQIRAIAPAALVYSEPPALMKLAVDIAYVCLATPVRPVQLVSSLKWIS